MYILGISAFYHDSAACLLSDGKIVAAAQEERFTRVKHDSRFPANAIKYCLAEAGIQPNQLDQVVFYEKPLPKFERLIETYLAFAPKGFKSFRVSMPVWLTDKIFQKRNLIKDLKSTLSQDVEWESKLLFSEHHLSHAASAFYPSPFESAAILTCIGLVPALVHRKVVVLNSFHQSNNTRLHVLFELFHFVSPALLSKCLYYIQGSACCQRFSTQTYPSVPGPLRPRVDSSHRSP